MDWRPSSMCRRGMSPPFSASSRALSVPRTLATCRPPAPARAVTRHVQVDVVAAPLNRCKDTAKTRQAVFRRCVHSRQTGVSRDERSERGRQSIEGRCTCLHFPLRATQCSE